MINHLEAEQGGNFYSNEARLGPEEIWRFGLFITLFAIYPLNAWRAQNYGKSFLSSIFKIKNNKVYFGFYSFYDYLSEKY